MWHLLPARYVLVITVGASRRPLGGHHRLLGVPTGGPVAVVLDAGDQRRRAPADAALPQTRRRKAHGDGPRPGPVPRLVGRLAGVGGGRLSAASSGTACRAARPITTPDKSNSGFEG